MRKEGKQRKMEAGLRQVESWVRTHERVCFARCRSADYLCKLMVAKNEEATESEILNLCVVHELFDKNFDMDGKI